jgi:hypothetical protein
VRIFSVAAVLGLVGIAMNERWMTGAAIVLLLTGFGLRFLPSEGHPGDRAGEELDDEDG